jgi:hypothetical protein
MELKVGQKFKHNRVNNVLTITGFLRENTILYNILREEDPTYSAGQTAKDHLIAILRDYWTEIKDIEWE